MKKIISSLQLIIILFFTIIISGCATITLYEKISGYGSYNSTRHVVDFRKACVKNDTLKINCSGYVEKLRKYKDTISFVISQKTVVDSMCTSKKLYFDTSKIDTLFRTNDFYLQTFNLRDFKYKNVWSNLKRPHTSSSRPLLSIDFKRSDSTWSKIPSTHIFPNKDFFIEKNNQYYFGDKRFIEAVESMYSHLEKKGFVVFIWPQDSIRRSYPADNNYFCYFHKNDQGLILCDMYTFSNINSYSYFPIKKIPLSLLYVFTIPFDVVTFPIQLIIFGNEIFDKNFTLGM